MPLAQVDADGDQRFAVRVLAVGTVRWLPGTPHRSRCDPWVLHGNQFLWVMEGTVTCTCDGETFDLGQNAVLLARAGVPDCFRWDGPGFASIGVIRFACTRPVAVDSWPSLRRLPPNDVIRPLFRHIAWLTDAKPVGWRRQRTAAAQLLLDAFVSGASDTKAQAQARLSPVVVRTMRYVAQVWSGGVMEPIRLADLAAGTSRSVRQVCRAFAESVGCGPIEALRLVRLDRAASLLMHTNHSVSKIAEITGFTSPFHFSHRFAQVYGESPRAFRRHVGQSSYAPDPPVPVQRLLGAVWEG